MVEFWECDGKGCLVTGTLQEVEAHIIKDGTDEHGDLKPVDQIVCWGCVKVLDYTKVRRDSNYDTDELTESQQAELDRRKEVDESLLSTEIEAEEYIRDVQSRRHLSWY